ncbi:MAG: hypothetical protein D8M58_11365 [Calditrichaeota bacterium]|nr:MAG: hypothetical protein DWQ03_10740 [Calditrichota bacterium]MBL1205992.1 hypothetical protein [Calditrichota bacterium]NOG45820.1 hypothetical protein [Calditrichota bacterium]
MEIEKLLKRQIDRLSNLEKKFQQTSQTYSWTRLASIILAIVVAVIAIYQKSEILAAISMAIVLFGFGALTFFHSRLKRSIQKFAKMISIYDQHLNRLNLNWGKLPEIKSEQKVDHPFGFDLDVFGPFSLIRLIDQTVSLQSSKIIHDWFLKPQLDSKTITIRQGQVKELISLTSFRNKLLVFGRSESFVKSDTKKLTDWLHKIQLKTAPWIAKTLIGLAAINITLYLLHQFEQIAPYWYFSFTLYVILHLWNQLSLNSFFVNTFELADDFRTASKTFLYLENFSLSKKESLKTLFKPFQQNGHKPSKIFKQLNRYIAAIGLRMNPVMAIILNIAVPWDYIVAFRLKKITASIKDRAPGWFEGWYNIDALSSLAQFSWLNPQYNFPQISQAASSAYFNSENMGHPLINRESRKLNDFSIEKDNQVNIITGSNMSGKSTFLRTIGLNLTLAYAGAPVCANQLNTQIFKLHSCIRINDSLSEGLSYFYAEVRRLKEILENLETSKDFPVLFLIDEIFKGTNNKERLIGSLSYIKELAAKNGIGLVSTHDLELVKLEEDISYLKNFHFREDIKSGKMVFDYKLRSGPSPTTNALKIMELEGLPVNKK